MIKLKEKYNVLADSLSNEKHASFLGWIMEAIEPGTELIVGENIDA